MQLLQEDHPEWIMRGCLAHGLSLAMKDFTTFTKGKGRYGGDRTWGLPWAQETLSMANKIANFLNDGGHAKMMVQQYQLEVYSREKQIVVKVPTRFASNHLVMKSISDSKQALIQAVVSEAWSVASGPGGNPDGNGAKVKAFIDCSHPDAQYLWENLEMLKELLRPFSDAIHQLEADRPLSLHEHVHNFAAKYEDLRDGSVVDDLKETFQRRYDAEGGGTCAPIYNVALTAAFMLDPYNAIRDDTGVWHMPAVEVELKRKAVSLVQRIAGPEAYSRADAHTNARRVLSQHGGLFRCARECQGERGGACGRPA
jgi:hypothetical protein